MSRCKALKLLLFVLDSILESRTNNNCTNWYHKFPNFPKVGFLLLLNSFCKFILLLLLLHRCGTTELIPVRVETVNVCEALTEISAITDNNH